MRHLFSTVGIALAASLFFQSNVATGADMPVRVDFRDIVLADGKPKEAAAVLDGNQVELVGFMTPAPDEEKAPFLVLVGARLSNCPYCEPEASEEKLPYVLVYPADDDDLVFSPLRVRVLGELEIGLKYDPVFGLPNEVRLVEAVIERDKSAERPRFRGSTNVTVDVPLDGD